MEQPFNPTQARFVGKSVDVKHDMQSKSVFHHDGDSSVTESSVAYLLESAEVLFQLSRGEGRCLIRKLLSIFQRTEKDFSTLHTVLKTRKHCSHIISKRSDGDLMSAGFL